MYGCSSPIAADPRILTSLRYNAGTERGVFFFNHADRRCLHQARAKQKREVSGGSQEGRAASDYTRTACESARDNREGWDGRHEGSGGVPAASTFFFFERDGPSTSNVRTRSASTGTKTVDHNNKKHDASTWRAPVRVYGYVLVCMFYVVLISIMFLVSPHVFRRATVRCRCLAATGSTTIVTSRKTLRFTTRPTVRFTGYYVPSCSCYLDFRLFLLVCLSSFPGGRLVACSYICM